MEDEAYHRLTDLCVGYLLDVLQPRLDRWAESKATRWQDSTAGGEGKRGEGRGHWQFEDHEEFRKLFEESMSTFLAEESCTQADFVAIIKRAHREGAAGTENMGSLLVDAMSAIDDFESFAFFMGTVVADGTASERDRCCRREGGEGAKEDDAAYNQRSHDCQQHEIEKDAVAGKARCATSAGRK